ncbi:Mediator of RNA polymerase II transcription subunit 13-like [Actinidia chinensis var. chinensis]|uniref:Mediator of RNA polymerase II transcription subunit 13-like n=1 Tax=Actinidia chinensis var. chinensis TaxID=1590841 RepID=A0A2R6QH67_ACTCC|nr:Mediator of RNA polymerase II transcription subunit 13-like [Actinidia chinensis var. chinensis]
MEPLLIAWPSTVLCVFYPKEICGHSGTIAGVDLLLLTKLLYLERFCNGFSAKKEFRVHVLNVEEGSKFSSQERVGFKKSILVCFVEKSVLNHLNNTWVARLRSRGRRTVKQDNKGPSESLFSKIGKKRSRSKRKARRWVGGGGSDEQIMWSRWFRWATYKFKTQSKNCERRRVSFVVMAEGIPSVVLFEEEEVMMGRSGRSLEDLANLWGRR